LSHSSGLETLRQLIDCGGATVTVWRCCGVVRRLWRCGAGLLRRSVADPLAAVWCLTPETPEGTTLGQMLAQTLPDLVWLLEEDTGQSEEWRESAVVAARRVVAMFKLMDALKERLSERGLWHHWSSVEMPCLVLLARLEMNGMGFSGGNCEKLVVQMRKCLAMLEAEARSLAGKQFQLGSFSEVAKVLFKDLALTTTHHWRNRLSKEALEDLCEQHPLPAVLLAWRKLYAALHKMILPLRSRAEPSSNRERGTEQEAGRNAKEGEKLRVYPRCHTHSATGRVSMSEPSLQCLPNRMAVSVRPALVSPASIFTTAAMKALRGGAEAFGEAVEEVLLCRSVIVAEKGVTVLVSADYCQLELRILAHCSGDACLKRLLCQSSKDPFTYIAETVLGSSYTGEDSREVAKKLCYAILYGMGDKTLAKQLEVTEEEAKAKKTQLLSSFPSVAAFLVNTVEEARKNGFVSTISGRRRSLPSINDPADSAKRAQNERQAVNTVIQGSAADLVKTAMVAVDSALSRSFPDMPSVIEGSAANMAGVSEVSGSCSGAHLVLQLHDELVYEVSARHVSRVAALLRHHMSRAVALQVPLPVKLRAGDTWADMQPLEA